MSSEKKQESHFIFLNITCLLYTSDQNFGNSKAMGGIAYGLRNGYQINASNPASYTAIDSLTLLFDAGMTLQNANFKDGNVKTNAKNSRCV